MSFIPIGQHGSKKVFVTPYSQKRFQQRNLSYEEAIEVLRKRNLSYPADEDGRQKIRSKLQSGKNAFLVIVEDSKQIVIITGGEA